ncbi:HPP family protein [Colletotrichum nymphaeae SA-01]|uniref:HPP family protein n=1 Tax=Colletotrichum nymphaeae SA-01 TaxID=1460502 RepID=A0A135UQD4_9PEZI|nr:HPP family protein [Colletotrichum nymphaeae SA-01]
MLRCNPRNWDFDIDRFLNPFVPPPPWKYLPYPISHFFGYRKSKPQNVGNLVSIFWACVGVFCGVAVVSIVSRQIPSFRDHGAPIIVGSFGAAAVLEFYSIESPLSQPRNSVFGQLLSAVVGVAICKLFQLSPHFDSIRWLGGALSCALATTVMALTKTVHPPAGATALLAVVDDGVVHLGCGASHSIGGRPRMFGYTACLGGAMWAMWKAKRNQNLMRLMGGVGVILR